MVGRRGGRAVLAVLAFSVLGVGSAWAQSYGSGSGGLSLSRTTVAPGDSLSASGNGYRSQSSVALTFESAAVALGTATTDTSGAFTVTLVIPTGATDGVHSIVATGSASDNSTLVLRGTVTVQRSGSNLVRTGSALINPMVVVAAYLILIGSWLVAAFGGRVGELVARRR